MRMGIAIRSLSGRSQQLLDQSFSLFLRSILILALFRRSAHEMALGRRHLRPAWGLMERRPVDPGRPSLSVYPRRMDGVRFDARCELDANVSSTVRGHRCDATSMLRGKGEGRRGCLSDGHEPVPQRLCAQGECWSLAGGHGSF